ncbi:MAG: M48 family metalloprotease [Phycisphaeraceae bacterium]|nr:M48 family metalloprotease [Phycisphaeraceae bacterium]
MLGLFVAVFLHDATTTVDVVADGKAVRAAEALPGDVWPGLSLWSVLLVVLLPKLFIGLSYWLACRSTHRRLGNARGQRSLNRLEAMSSALPLVLLCLFIVDLSAGALRHLRVPLQHTVLVDELLIMLPTLLTVVWAWAAYQPIDRRLREALIMRDADAGKPVYPLLPRGAYIAMQLRHQFGLLLLPLLAVFAWSETLTLLGPNFGGPLSDNAAMALSPLGVLVIFIGAPLIIRHVWHTRPLPAGEVRDRMVVLCEQHNVRVRELLLWQTSGRMINAAVTGLVSKVRYILLSDGLLDQLGPREIEAVMAHELAHVKHKHLIWMALVVVALLGSLEGGGYAALDAWAGPMQTQVSGLSGEADSTSLTLNDPNVRMAIVSIPAFMAALLTFGWVSRRIERQADVFAVQHLAMNAEDAPAEPPDTRAFDEASVQTMIHALQRVSELNHAPTTRKSWRHGSIAWRQDHLRSLIGQPLDTPAIDRVLLRIKVATLIGLLITASFYFA